jgi:hypothetical protein
MKHPMKRTFAAVALVMALAAISAPMAQARFQVDPPNGSAIAVSRPAPATVKSTSAGSSFDWGDAAIGATVMLAVISLAAGAVVLSRRSRSQAAVS